ncbi:hypothetical protein QLY43_20530 [Cronobacter dublinensis]|uniref:hypothetical protein n=1 Tax=Cronobacter dublinensis TaxID=413497 RepID=UPI0024AEFC87|nr:hypothetical protein [Cronobacter dublinensis]MDI7399061.1 hypothetical protein [Cronobacter dublinensis]
MENLIVTIKGDKTGPHKVTRFFYEQENYDILVFEGDDVANKVFCNLGGATSVEVSAQNQPLGLYTLLTASANEMVLVKGDAETAQRLMKSPPPV